MSIVDRTGMGRTDFWETLLLVGGIVLIWQVSFEAVVVVLLFLILYETRSRGR